MPVLAGSTFADTARSVELTRQVLETGVTGVLATTPAYARPSQKGIAAHFAAIASCTELPVMLYDVPSRTGRKIAASTTIELVSSHSNIVAIKDASGDLVSAAHYKSVLGDNIDMYSGDDSVLVPFLGIGAVGIISVAAHWAAREFVQVVECVERGDWVRAREYNERLATSYAFENGELYPNPMPAKAALRYLGIRRRPVPTPARRERRHSRRGRGEDRGRAPGIAWLRTPFASPSSAASERSAATAPPSSKTVASWWSMPG